MKTIKTAVFKIRQLKSGIYILYLACRDPRVPWYVKAFLLFLVAYAISPVDIVPDFIPVLGYIVDLIILPVGIYLALKMIPDEILEEYRRQVRSEIIDRKLIWTGTSVVVIIWLLILYLIINIIL